MTVKAAVVCPEPLAADAGRDILATGGNAVDAAIAAAFVQAVTNPFECGLGGGGKLHYYSALKRASVIVNFHVTAGSRAIPSRWASTTPVRAEGAGRYFIDGDENQVGYKAIMTPGFVRGCWTAFNRYGSRRVQWREVLAPAIAHARGFSIYRHLEKQWEDPEMYAGRNLFKTLATTKAAARAYLKADGRGYRFGETLKQPELATTLEHLARLGGEDFYSGELAAAIAEDLESGDALISRSDLLNYQVLEEAPIQMPYRDLVVATTPSPSAGPQLLQMLKIWERLDAPLGEHNGVRHLDLIARVQRASFSDAVASRDAPAGNEEVDVVADRRVRHWVDRIRAGDRIVHSPAFAESGTTHVTCIDRELNVVSLTHSIGTLGGSGVMSEGLGFLYNDFLGHLNPRPGYADSIVANKRMGGGPPTIIFRDSSPHLALGAPGGSRLITSIFQVIVNSVDFGMSMQEAVSASRIHSEQRELVLVEADLPRALALGLSELGNEVVRTSTMSRVQAIRVGADSLEAAPDPRGGAVSVLH
jgi:gamma-glutamyltranspeptidase/glutathione hydrolase